MTCEELIRLVDDKHPVDCTSSELFAAAAHTRSCERCRSLLRESASEAGKRMTAREKVEARRVLRALAQRAIRARMTDEELR